MATTYSRLHDLTTTILPLHDGTFLKVSPLTISIERDESHLPFEERVVQFTHVTDEEKEKDEPMESWLVQTSSMAMGVETKEWIAVVPRSSLVPELPQYAGWLWCTLYWYFHLPAKSHPEEPPTGAPKADQQVTITVCQPRHGSVVSGLKVDMYKRYLYELERYGLLYCSSTCATHFGIEEETPDAFFILEKAFWQIPYDTYYALNNPGLKSSMPLPAIAPPVFVQHGLSSRHPHRPRPPPPGVTFYQRYIPSLSSFLTFRTVDLERDTPTLHKWMNSPRVNHFWGEGGPESHQATYLKNGLAGKHYFPVIGSWRKFDYSYDKKNGALDYKSIKYGPSEPFGYFEFYWVKEDRLAAHTETGDWDRGVHVLVGEEKYRGKHRVEVWLSSLVHYMFLSDPRTMTLMLEPRIDNDKFINYLIQAGFYKEKEFAFPHKQAAVLKLKREAWVGPKC